MYNVFLDISKTWRRVTVFAGAFVSFPRFSLYTLSINQKGSVLCEMSAEEDNGWEICSSASKS